MYHYITDTSLFLGLGF